MRRARKVRLLRARQAANALSSEASVSPTPSPDRRDDSVSLGEASLDTLHARHAARVMQHGAA